MAQYIPTLEFYTNNELSLVSLRYASSEAFFGLNLEPLSKNVSYTFLPNMSYFEFLDVDGGAEGEIVDLVNVKLGRYMRSWSQTFPVRVTPFPYQKPNQNHV
ncbi:unnamed protein product [Brassica napus]|uniref:(rape) hypothetical protein n=1 Tax=Brassica napus TaxID=3708 RepID=A0A816S218_BRANA|nr:unnamed protein product [Brassica napus]